MGAAKEGGHIQIWGAMALRGGSNSEGGRKDIKIHLQQALYACQQMMLIHWGVKVNLPPGWVANTPQGARSGGSNSEVGRKDIKHIQQTGSLCMPANDAHSLGSESEPTSWLGG